MMKTNRYRTSALFDCVDCGGKMKMKTLRFRCKCGTDFPITDDLKIIHKKGDIEKVVETVIYKKNKEKRVGKFEALFDMKAKVIECPICGKKEVIKKGWQRVIFVDGKNYSTKFWKMLEPTEEETPHTRVPKVV